MISIACGVVHGHVSGFQVSPPGALARDVHVIRRKCVSLTCTPYHVVVHSELNYMQILVVVLLVKRKLRYKFHFCVLAEKQHGCC